MGARELLGELTTAGLTVVAEGERLVVWPASLLTDDQRVRLRAAKPELLVLLGAAPRATARIDRLLRWGWSEDEAIAMAKRLGRRDREGDERVSCADCAFYVPGRCGNHRRAGLSWPDLGRDMASMLQHCPGFKDGGS